MSSWMYRPRCTPRLQKICRDMEFKKKRTFPQPSLMEVQEQLQPKIDEMQNGLKKELEVMKECFEEDYLLKEKELENIGDNEINAFVDGYEYRTKQLLEMMRFLMGALEKACSNEKEMLDNLEKDSKLADIVKHIKESEEEEKVFKEKEEMMKSNFKEEKKVEEINESVNDKETEDIKEDKKEEKIEEDTKEDKKEDKTEE